MIVWFCARYFFKNFAAKGSENDPFSNRSSLKHERQTLQTISLLHYSIPAYRISFFMHFRFVWVGKTKDKNWRALQEEYLRRLSHFVKFEISEIKDGAVHETKEAEGKRLLEKLHQSTFTCLLDVTGRTISSHDLASLIVEWQNRGIKEVAFVIGGADGVSPEVAEKADLSLSLSGFTFTHETARVLLAEQLYRAFTIIKGFPYQK